MIARYEGGGAIIEQDKNQIRQYLLGQLNPESREQLELRLLTDQAFVEEFDTIVDEITDQYVGGELDPDERGRVEKHFLQADERRRKVKFATALIEHAAATRGDKPTVAVPAANPNLKRTTSLFDRFRAFWQMQAIGYRFATIFVAVLILAGIVFLLRPGGTNSQNTVLVVLSISRADRAAGAESKPVKVTPEIDALRITMQLPEEAVGAKNFSVELIGENDKPEKLEIAEQDSRTVTTLVPASIIKPGRYDLHLFTANADGSPQRVRGSYLFSVE